MNYICYEIKIYIYDWKNHLKIYKIQLKKEKYIGVQLNYSEKKNINFINKTTTHDLLEYMALYQFSFPMEI